MLKGQQLCPDLAGRRSTISPIRVAPAACRTVETQSRGKIRPDPLCKYRLAAPIAICPDPALSTIHHQLNPISPCRMLNCRNPKPWKDPSPSIANDQRSFGPGGLNQHSSGPRTIMPNNMGSSFNGPCSRASTLQTSVLDPDSYSFRCFGPKSRSNSSPSAKRPAISNLRTKEIEPAASGVRLLPSLHQREFRATTYPLQTRHCILIQSRARHQGGCISAIHNTSEIASIEVEVDWNLPIRKHGYHTH
ncbi:hypothetical protein ACLOJK_004750 [Asimina triloba]